MLAEARAEADAILARTREDANRFRDELKQKAQAEAASIVKNAERQIELETARALQQIRTEAVEFSVAIASKILQRNVSKEDNERLIEETFRQIESTAPQLVRFHGAVRRLASVATSWPRRRLVGGIALFAYAVRDVGWADVVSRHPPRRLGAAADPRPGRSALRPARRGLAALHAAACAHPAAPGVHRVSRRRRHRQRHAARPDRQRTDEGLPDPPSPGDA